MEPPKDRNFLARIVTFGWSSEICQSVATGTKWCECWWHEKSGVYREWCGNKATTLSSGEVIIQRWEELP